MATYLEYIRAAIRHAEIEKTEDGTWFASIPKFEGLWAIGPTRESAAQELCQTLDGWLDVHIKIGREEPPEVDGVKLHSMPKVLEE
jgi:predicted RNase H-like HicB family nuclease